MKLFLALSCLQGRPMAAAFEELRALQPDGIQLTAGNAPTSGFMKHAEQSGMALRTHHAFTPSAMRLPVWTEDLRLNGMWDSVHPPRGGPADWLPEADVCLETMYRGYPLGDGGSVSRAMDERRPLAVDVSHVFIQLSQGVMSAAVWRRLQEYECIREIHVSQNDGARDQHRAVTRDCFGLDWVRERSAVSDMPVILESYFHLAPCEERRVQMDLVRGSGA